MADIDDIDRPEPPSKPLGAKKKAKFTADLIDVVDLTAIAHKASITETLDALDITRRRLEAIRDK